MKIGFVFDDTLDSADGVQQYVLTVSQWLTAQGHEVHYLVGETTRRDLPNLHSLSKNVKVRFNQNRMSIPLPARKRDIERVVLAEDFDVLHVQVPYSPTMAAKVINAAPPSTAIVGTFHILPFSAWQHRANRALALALRRNLKKFHAFISVSSAAQTFAKEVYGIESVIIPNTVESNRFMLARPFPNPDNRRRIVFVGRLVARKGCIYLLRAVQRLVQDGVTDIHVDVCGRGELEPELKRFVAEHKLEDIVTFHGFVSEADKARFLAGADIAVFPSLGGECFGIVLIEAMAAGSKVVLGGDNAGYASVLRAEQLFNPRSVRALTVMLQSYLEDTPVALAATQEATRWQLHAVKQYDVNIVGTQLLKLYRETLHRRGYVR